MATIRRRDGKRGISYEVQVKVRDIQSGELKVKATTWKPPSDLTKKQVEKELTLFAMNYEKEMQDLINCGSSSEIENPNTTFKEYAEKWLERAKPNISVNYYANSLTSIEASCQYIGGYKLKDLNPRIIQNFYDKLDKLEKVTYRIVAKDSLRTVITKKKLTYSQLRYGDKFKCGAIDAAMNHKSISMKSAARIAEALNVDIESIFDIETTRQPYAYETIHKIKRTVRTVLSSAKRQRLIVDNWATAEYITFGARPPHEVVCMEEDDAKQFYKGVMAYPELKCKTAALLFLMTGFRLGELCGLEWSDIDFDKQTIRVARSISSVGVRYNLERTENGIFKANDTSDRRCD
ncbi:MAG: tyrosine-type recombinase/integrase [Clostridia bacterium]